MFIRRFYIAALLSMTYSSPVAWGEDLFHDQVAPIFSRHCLNCHNSRDRKGELALDTAAGIRRGGDRGPVIDPGEVDSSYLVELITPIDGKAAMPKDGQPLSVDEIVLIRRWIEEGAKWPEGVVLEPELWWSLRPLQRPQLPRVSRNPNRSAPSKQSIRRNAWTRTPIDVLVWGPLERYGLSPSPEADRRTLIRRLYFDLLGLPPAPEEIQRFMGDASPEAHERLVDRLLASPHYGERWARRWLDVVKYADTCGYDKDRLRPNAYPYRDYVIRSLNQDKPYWRFVQEQIAGDVLFPNDPDGILGLGFIAAGPWDFIGHVEVAESKIDGKVARHIDRDEMVTNTMNTFNSVTIQCARCHDHKFDPFTQRHYYSLQAVFAAVDRADRFYDKDSDVQQRYQELGADLNDAIVRLARLNVPIRDKAGDELTEVTERQQLRNQVNQRITSINEALATLAQGRMVYAAATHFTPYAKFLPTHGKPRMIHVLHRGNVLEPRDEVGPGTLPIISSALESLGDTNSAEGERRAALAQWLTRQDHPLTWRSIVNRIWLYHFGRGLVETPNDFGRMGQLPSHPRLLDWLGIEFRDRGQSMKKLHRLIVTSSVYRQSSTHSEANAKIDASNRFLWRMNRRRLEAEEIRDAILSVSNRLGPKMYGPGFFLFVLEKAGHSPHYEYHKYDANDASSHRRSIYRFVVRSQPNPFMTTLDCADSSQSTPKRNETLTSLQALSLLNNKFTLVMSRHYAERVVRERATLPEQVERTVWLANGRAPTETERQRLVDFAQQHGLANLCRVLFNLSEFVYLD